MAKYTPILCRVCKKKMGVVPNFEGHVFTLCSKCEVVLKEMKKQGILPGEKIMAPK
jgi:hypothetical protein